MIFENKPRKVTRAELKSRLGIDLAELPYSLKSLKATFRSFPRHYLSGWQSSPTHLYLDYEAGKGKLAQTNYIAQLCPSSATHARRASEVLTKRLGFPLRVWMASFMTRPYLSRPSHYDWYDGILYNFSGRKTVRIHAPLPINPAALYRYPCDESHHEKPTAQGINFTLDAGEAVHIPAFSHHFVENVGTEETAAVSFAFDSAALLGDIFKHTLEYCLGEPRTPYQARSMGGPRLYGTKERWKAWRAELKTGKFSILKGVQEELAEEFPAAGPVLAKDPGAKALLRGEWETLLRNPGLFNNRVLFNP